MKKVSSLLVILICTALGWAQAAPSTNQLLKIGSVAGEAGIFASLNSLITVYSEGSIRAQFGDSPKWQPVDHSGPVSFEIKDEHLRRSQDNVPLAVAHEFDFCDALNQVNISTTVDKAIVLLLPKGSKIKAAEEINERLSLIVYSSASEPVRYDIHVALFKKSSAHSYSIIGTDTISTNGSYCGMRSFGEQYRAIFVDEPAGSSDFSAAYFYELRP